MANTINYAEKWNPKLLDIVIQNTITSPFITDAVEWLKGKTFHFTQMTTSGYRNHVVGAEIKAGKIEQTDVPYVIEHDREFSLLLDKSEELESGGTATIENANMVFQKVHASKEVDALFFNNVSQKALLVEGHHDETALSAFTKLNVLDKLLAGISKVKKYRNTAIMYVRTEIMDLVEAKLADQSRVTISTISDYENSIQTRVATIQGVPVIEVLDDECFYTKFDWLDTEDGGFAPNSAGKKINFLIASTDTVKTVKKIQSIYVYAPGTHTRGDGFYTYTRDLFDTFIFPNGKDGSYDSIYVSHDTEPIGA